MIRTAQLTSILLVLICTSTIRVYAQTDWEKPVEQALQHYNNKNYSRALPTLEKYETELLDYYQQQPKILKGLYTIFHTAYIETQQAEKAEKYTQKLAELQTFVTKCKALNQKGMKAVNQENYREAQQYFRQALSFAQKAVGKLDKAYAKIADNVAFAYKQLGEYAPAEAFYLEVQQVYQKISGEDSPDYLKACQELMNIYLLQEKFTKAENQGLAIQRKISETKGRVSKDYMLICNDLARLYAQKRQHQKAEQLYLESKEICVKISGKNNENYIAIW